MKINKSVLKFTPLESPIMFASVKIGSSAPNLSCYYKLTEAFANITDLWSIDFSNFVPWCDPNIDDSTLTNFANIGSNADNTYRKPDFKQCFEGCTNLASVDLRTVLTAINLPGNDNPNDYLFGRQGLAGCPNLNYIYCNETVGNLISANLGAINSIGSSQTATDQDGESYTYYYTATIEGREWYYDADVEAVVIYPKQAST